MHDSDSYLSVEEAAERLGISTIRLRLWIREKRVEAMLDNQGRWRVRLKGDPRNVPPVPPADSAEAIDVLIDEIMELRFALADKTMAAERLRILAERQQQALENAVTRAEAERAARRRAESESNALEDQVRRSLDLAAAAVALIERAGRQKNG